MTWLTRHYVAQLAERAEGWFQAERGWPREWRDALGYGDDGVVVTAEQATAMGKELMAVIDRYRNAGVGDPDARRVLVSTMALPVHAQFEESRS